MNTLYDVIIIGAGPAGTAAAVYSARKRMKTLLVADSFGGQSIVSDDIQNWIGDPHISGFDLAQKFEAHVRAYADTVIIKTGEKAAMVRAEGEDFLVETDKGRYTGKAVILAAGARRRRLGVPGEDVFEGKGVAFCSTCDAPLFAGKRVAVVGGGNAGLEAVMDLFPYAESVYVLETGDTLKGDPFTQEEVKKNPKLAGIIFNAQATEVVGGAMMTGLKYKDRVSGEEKILAVEGVFVEIGSVPNSEMAKGLVEIDARGQVVVDSKLGTTSRAGIFAAGDITDDPFKQNNISAGDAVKAALSAYAYIQKRHARDGK